ncbi:ankyrin repeat domain-containing protein [Wolbachia endosymbiont (group B) of Eucosma cana]|uniref:ankyrin repeat domain-containing protein n=2 Tax=unclassified Wolbachia TaxID=2640676 RepID=UPI002226679D|nr:ankyrin repeat domain-containing protein [Wolbachia endosymbiont (group B) of Eucosma cana]
MPSQKQLNAQLIDAAKEGELRFVQQAIQGGAMINTIDDDYGRTALMWASRNGQLEIVQYLIEEGANVNAESPGNITALIHAAAHGHLEVVQLLIANGADLNVKREGQFSALTYAIVNGNTEVAKLLTRYHLIANLDMSIPRLPLPTCIPELSSYWYDCKDELNKMKEEDSELYNFLVSKGIDDQVRIWTESETIQNISQDRLNIEYLIYAKDLTGKIESVIFFLNNREIINSLSRYYEVGIKTIDQVKSLLDRFIREYVELEVEIVPAQLNFNTQELQPPTLKTLSFVQMINNHAGLFSAAKSGQLETVRYLIEKQKEDINATDNYGRTALMWAAGSGYLEVVKYLIETAKANVNVKDNYENTALNYATRNGHLDVKEYLKGYIQKELRKKYVCIGVSGTIGYVAGMTISCSAGAAIAVCAASATISLALGAIFGYTILEVKKEKANKGIASALKDVFTIQALSRIAL